MTTFKLSRLFSIPAGILAVAFLPAPGVLAGDWPEFRGPGGQGHSHETGLPAEWSTNRNVAWKTSLPGQGWSSPIVHRARVYVTSAIKGGGDSLSLHLISLDAKTGEMIWSIEVFPPATGPAIHSKNSHASSTPIAEGDRIYAHFGHKGTACVDVSGKIIWRNASLKYSPVHGNGGSPALSGNKLFFSADGGADPFLAALDKTTGDLIWKAARKTAAKNKFSFSTPLVMDADGRKELISPGSGMVGAYDLEDGAELWRVNYGEGYSVIPRPVAGHGLIFIGTGYDRPSVLAIRPGRHGDVTESNVAWTLTRGAPNTPSLLLIGDELYMVSDAGIASCVDARTGTAHWQERLGGNFSASPIFADGKIYFQNEQGLGTVIRPGKSFAVLAKNSLEERTLASYAVSDRSLFIRTESHLYRIQEQGSRN